MEEDIQPKPGEPRATPIYNPPDGFAILTKNNNGNQKVAEVFSRTNLAGKQLWYITAPASVPISAVKQVSLQDVQLGKPALSLGGRDYGFVQDQAGDRSFTNVLIPEENSTAYRVGREATLLIMV
jgi:DNA-directed RNA polymerase I subunit RPA34.5